MNMLSFVLGGLIWLMTSFILMTRSPRNKTLIWRVTQVIISLTRLVENFCLVRYAVITVILIMDGESAVHSVYEWRWVNVHP